MHQFQMTWWCYEKYKARKLLSVDTVLQLHWNIHSYQTFSAHSHLITCLGIHIEVRAVRFQHLEGKLPLRGSVRVCGWNLDDWLDLLHVLLHGRKIHRLRELWSIVIDIQDLQEHVSPGCQGFRPQISDVDREPVVRRRLAVQRLCRTDHTWGTWKGGEGENVMWTAHQWLHVLNLLLSLRNESYQYYELYMD